MYYSEKIPSSRLRGPSSRCFRTLADGRIALNPDWRGLLGELRKLGKVAIQTRHAYARMVACAELPAEWLETDPCWVSAEGGALHLNFSAMANAWAKLDLCDCCGSPGLVEFCNARDFDFLQISPRPGCTLTSWAGIVGKLIQGSAWNKSHGPAGAPASLCLARDTPFSPLEVSALSPLLSALGRDGIAISWMLGTAEACHIREFIPRRLTEDEKLLTAWNDDMSVQLALPGVHSLVLNRRQSSWPLHVIGPEETVLLTLSAGAAERDAAGWRAALQTLSRFH